MTAERETWRPEWAFIAVLVLINLAAKGAFIGINTGEYTDGILQLTVFENKAGLYPPLYGALAHGISALGVSLETAGRIISVVAAGLCVAPVYWLGLRLGGPGGARLAGLLYTVAPMPWRWSVRVMTDSLFLLLSTLTLVLLVEAWARSRRAAVSVEVEDEKDRNDLNDQKDLKHNEPDATDFRDNDTIENKRFRFNEGRIVSAIGGDMPVAHQCLAGAVVVAGFSALTRYQGVLFAPLIALLVVFYFRRFRRIPWLALAAGVIWLALPGWMWYNGFVHQDQFASRTALTLTATLSAWWNTFESFVLISPYYMGYPIVFAAVGGVFAIKRVASPGYAAASGWLWGLYALMLLGLHSAFGSFQYRYMMPLLPIFAVLAAVGFSSLERHYAARRWVFSAVLLGSVIYLVVFSLAVLSLQRETFGDQREAAEFIRKQVPADTPVFANEQYGSYTGLGAVKLSFWSGRPVETLASPEAVLTPGSVLALGTAYGGAEAVQAQMQALSEKFELVPLTPQPFRSVITPLMDDIMVNPMFNQNPLGWVLRYVPQRFATQLFLVQARSGAGGAGV